MYIASKFCLHVYCITLLYTRILHQHFVFRANANLIQLLSINSSQNLSKDVGNTHTKKHVTQEQK